MRTPKRSLPSPSTTLGAATTNTTIGATIPPRLAAALDKAVGRRTGGAEEDTAALQETRGVEARDMTG
jgi:hypothetical protein